MWLVQCNDVDNDVDVIHDLKCNLLGMKECTLQYRKAFRQVEVRSSTSNTMTLKTWRDC